MMSQSNLLERLEELKKWQQQQQERLLRQHQQRLQEHNLESTDPSPCNSLESSEVNLNVEGVRPLELQASPSPPLITDGECVEKMDVAEKPKVKRPYLRKGAGLARYRLTGVGGKKPIIPKERKPVEKHTKVSFAVGTNKTDLNVRALAKPVAQISLPPEKPVENRINSFNKDVIAKINQFASEKSKDTEQNGSFDRTSEQELLIFETLERRALSSSFCSTNSSIIRLLSSTPRKNPSQNPPTSCYAQQFTMEQKFGSCNSIDTADDSELVERLLSDHLHGKNIDDFLRNLQKLRQNDDSSSSITSEDIEERTLGRNFNDCEPWTSGSVKTVDTGAESSFSSQENVREIRDVSTNTSLVAVEDVLAEKLKELDEEIRSFRVENDRIEKVKRELQTERNEFYKEKKKFMSELEDEKTQMRSSLETERQKLAKDRMVFERYVKDAQNRPTKQERTELSDLRIEVANLKELQKLKESKNGITQARLRNQIKTLEKENANLKSEVEKLGKQNAKLLANQRITPKVNDTKMLHTINKNLTKLAKDVKARKSLTSEDDSDVSPSVVKVKPRSRVNSERSEDSSGRRSFGDERRLSPVDFVASCRSEGKENDVNGLNVRDLSVEETYGQVFGKQGFGLDETKKGLDKIETILPNGTKQTRYSNGNLKTVSADGNHITVKYYNGDHKETNLLGGFIRYTYSESGAVHTTHADGREILQFTNGQTERRTKDGASEITFPDGTVRKLGADGSEEIRYVDGSVVTVGGDGERVLLLPNGQKEVHTKEHKRREYPDGTVKILYPDGTQETRYANGRVRLKDREGKLLMDSHA